MDLIVPRHGTPLRVAAALGVLLAVTRSVFGCGLDWHLPRNHFDGVDAYGHISYWERIGEVDCGEGLSLPLQINFNSGRDSGAPSPYLGQGWLLPLLESRFIQDDETHFHMVQPDGLNNRFLRGNSDERVLDGSAGWKAEIKSETITAWAACGWKLVFTSGHVASMTTPKGRQLDWVYEGGRVSELREGSATRLKVQYGPDGRAAALSLPGGKRILLALDKKPRVQSIGGQEVIAGVDSSLSELTLADGQKRHFVFSTDEKKLPTLKIEGQKSGQGTGATLEPSRLLGWDPQTRLASRDGDWNYQVIPNADPESGDAAITRTDATGEKEYWFKDKANGQETTQGVDGTKYVKSWCLDGSMRGRLRKVLEVKDGVSRVASQFTYDQNGRLLREVKYDDKGTKTELFKTLSATGAQTDAQETNLKSRISQATTVEQRERAIQKLCFFYIHTRKTPDKAVQLVTQITNPNRHFDVLLHVVCYDHRLKPSDKVAAYGALQKRYPNKLAILQALADKCRDTATQ